MEWMLQVGFCVSQEVIRLLFLKSNPYLKDLWGQRSEFDKER